VDYLPTTSSTTTPSGASPPSPFPVGTGPWGRPASAPSSAPLADGGSVPEYRGFASPPPAPPPPRRAWTRIIAGQTLAAAAILVTVALVVPHGSPGSSSWSEAARPVITALSNDVAAAHQDLATRGEVAPAVRSALVSDLRAARRVGTPAETTVAAEWSDALYQLSASLRASAPEPFLLRARQDLLAVGQVAGP
jgi:hypothetical protein